jgi:HK97 family phage prohead protease
MRVAGYAAVFDQTISVDGLQESIAPDAFAEMLRYRRPCALRYDTHDASPSLARTGDGSLRLWADSYGLAFEARLNPRLEAVAVSLFDLLRHDDMGCSVGLPFFKSQCSIVAGKVARRIIMVRTDHFCATREPAYRGTALWRPDAMHGRTPLRVRLLAEQWERSRPR